MAAVVTFGPGKNAAGVGRDRQDPASPPLSPELKRSRPRPGGAGCRRARLPSAIRQNSKLTELRAYRIWDEVGRPEGKAGEAVKEKNWVEAEKQVIRGSRGRAFEFWEQQGRPMGPEGEAVQQARTATRRRFNCCRKPRTSSAACRFTNQAPAVPISSPASCCRGNVPWLKARTDHERRRIASSRSPAACSERRTTRFSSSIRKTQLVVDLNPAAQRLTGLEKHAACTMSLGDLFFSSGLRRSRPAGPGTESNGVLPLARGVLSAAGRRRAPCRSTSA